MIEFYERSGEFSARGLLLALVLGLSGGFLGVVIAAVIWNGGNGRYIPYAVPLFIGTLAGWGLRIGVRWGKVRSATAEFGAAVMVGVLTYMLLFVGPARKCGVGWVEILGMGVRPRWNR